MCTILIAWRCLDGADLVVAANRDELVSRPAAPPALLRASPAVYGGRDLLAGGTWLAVRSDGCFAAVTNRRGGDADGDEARRDPSRRSRGELPLLGLGAARARDGLASVIAGLYNPFNLLVVDQDAAMVAHSPDGKRLEIVELDPGPHVLCVHDVDDSRHAKERRLHGQLAKALTPQREAGPAVGAMMAMLRDHRADGDARDATCIHGEEYGTVSASVVVRSTAQVRYRHAPGRPCVTEFSDVPLG
jgi:uncharacterized protein with NRDE domain